MIEILIPTFNGARYLNSQLSSIFNQSFFQWRILIRDDGSTDGTLELIEEWRSSNPERFFLISDNEKGLGVSQSFARLLAHSSASYVMLCDQDDYWYPDKILKSFEAIRQEEVKMVFGFPLMVCTDLEIVDSELNFISKSFWSDRKDSPEILEDYEKLIAHSVVTGNTILLNRPAVNLVIPIKTNFFLYDQWIAIKVAKYGKIIFLNEPLVKYRQHSSNVLGSFRFSKKYLLNKVKYIPYYIRSWIRLKSELKMDFSVKRVLLFKVKYNLGKIFHS
jgi:glycosyltransferase involved in cell wall biosynthesis